MLLIQKAVIIKVVFFKIIDQSGNVHLVEPHHVYDMILLCILNIANGGRNSRSICQSSIQLCDKFCQLLVVFSGYSGLLHQ